MRCFTLLATVIIPVAVLAVHTPKKIEHIRDAVMLKRSKVHRLHGEKARFIRVQAENDDSLSSSVAAVVSFVNAAASSSLTPPTMDYIAAADQISESSSSFSPEDRLQEKIEISNGDFYFSQTDSYAVPSLSTFSPDSPYIEPFLGIPNKKPIHGVR